MDNLKLIPIKYEYTITASKEIAEVTEDGFFSSYLEHKTKSKAREEIKKLFNYNIIAYSPNIENYKELLRVGDLFLYSDSVTCMLQFKLFINEKDRYKRHFINGAGDYEINKAFDEGLKVVKEKINAYNSKIDSIGFRYNKNDHRLDALRYASATL